MAMAEGKGAWKMVDLGKEEGVHFICVSCRGHPSRYIVYHRKHDPTLGGRVCTDASSVLTPTVC